MKVNVVPARCPNDGSPVTVVVKAKPAGSVASSVRVADVCLLHVTVVGLEFEMMGMSVTLTAKVKVEQRGSGSQIFATIEIVPTSPVA